MKIEQVMTKDVATCYPEDRVVDAAALMADRDTGCVVVLERGGSARVAGILTDRDVCHAVANPDRPLEDLAVRFCMSAPVHCCRTDDALWELLALAEAHRVRRFPVVDSGGQLLGIVSLDDLAREAARPQSGIQALSAREVCRAISLCSRGKRPEALSIAR